MEPTYDELKAKVSHLEKQLKERSLSKSGEPAEQDEKYRLLWETMTQGVIYQAPDGQILSANPAAEGVLGITSDQMQGKTSMDPRWKMIEEDGTILKGDEHPAMLSLKTGEKIGPVIRGVFHPGRKKYVWLSIVSIPLFREGENKPYLAYATFDDITEKKEAEENYQKSKDSLAFALEANQMGAWELDPTNRQVHRSLKHDQIFGYTELQAHWTFDTFIEHVHPEDVNRVRKELNEALENKKKCHFECRIRRADGSERWISVSARHIKDDKNALTRLAGIVQDITDSKKNNLALQHREKLLGYIIKYNPSAIALHDKDLNYLFVSDRYINDYKVKDPNIIGKHHYEVFPDLPEKWRKVHQRALAGEVISSEEDTYNKEDGSKEYTRWLCRPWHTEEGEIGGIILYTEVITERKRIELKHKETALQLNLVLQNAGDGIFSVDTHDRTTMINAAALKMLGYSRNELMGKAMHHAHHHTKKDGSPYPKEECPIHLSFQEGKSKNQTDEVFWRKEGTSFPVEYMSTPIKENGKITGAVVSFRDITFRKKTEERIHKLNTQLKEIINTINRLSKADDISLLQTIVADAARKLVNANGTTFVINDNGFCRYVEENTDVPLWKGMTFPINKCITGWVMLNKKPAIIEDIYEDGRIPIELYKNTFVKSLAVFPANDTDPRFAIGCYWAVHYTPDKHEVQLIQTLAEAANIAYNNISLRSSLEDKVQERTQKLEFINKELEAFSYSVSHDLRAPLRIINGFSNILIKEHANTMDEESLRITNIIIENAQNMGRLIDDLLAFSRLSRKEIRTSPIDMQDMVNTVFLELTKEDQRKNIHFTLSKLDPCFGDSNLIKQVMINLLSNAIKYSSTIENPKIEVYSKIKSGAVWYYVKDNGVGFNMKYKDKVFGVFQRLHSDAEFEGTGVGLAIVQRIIHRHSGYIDADAKLGEGATFWFSLPQAKNKLKPKGNHTKKQNSIF